MAKRHFCLTLDLKDDAELIEQYEQYHKPGNVFPEVIESIIASGIEDMKIFRSGKRLMMFMVVSESFSFEDKSQSDKDNPRVQEWEDLMDKFQRRLTEHSNQKWVLSDEIFSLSEHI